MKALTLYQPYASLVAIGAKRIETRSWSTPYRGALMIHAGKTVPIWVRNICESEPLRTWLHKVGIRYWLALPRGVAVARCELIDCVPINSTLRHERVVHTQWGGLPAVFQLTDQEIAFGDYTPGRFAWLLANVVPYDPPISARGMLGLWEWSE